MIWEEGESDGRLGEVGGGKLLWEWGWGGGGGAGG